MSVSVPELLAIAVAALGGSERPDQLEMASAVEQAFETGEHLVVQAGTGTGKSLAYLVPAVRYALTTGNTVVVATATIAAYIGLGGLGRFIIDGLSSYQYGPVAGGALLVVILAVLVLGFFALLSRLIVPAGLRGQGKTE